MSEIIKQLDLIDSDVLLSFYHTVEKEIEWYTVNGKSRQSSLQHDLNGKQYTAGCGTSSGNDFVFNIVSDIYKNTIVENFIKKFNLVRTRWMWVEPYACYSMHYDRYPRIHIPLVTNKDCYFIFPDTKEEKLASLSLGKIYWLNTMERHTFVNCSSVARLHLVGSINH